MRIRRRSRRGERRGSHDDPELAAPAQRAARGAGVRDLVRAVADRATAPPPQQDQRDVRSALAADVRAVLSPIRAAGKALVALIVEPDPPRQPPGPHRFARAVRRAPTILVVFAVVLFLVGIPTVGNDYRVAPLLMPVVAAVITLPLWLVSATPLRAWRVTVLLGVLLPIFVQARVDTMLPWPVTQVFVTLVVYFAVALRHRWPIVASVGLVTPIGAWLATLLAGSVDAPGQTAATTVVLGLVLLIGYLAGSRGEMARRLDEGERQREESETRRAVLEERARIARELHDVVAHHMSMISVQAETAPFRVPELGEDGRAVLASIAEASREALADMRRLLGVLREGQRGADRAPQPDLGQLDQLIAGARRAGLSVDLHVEGEARSLLPGTELSAYRIVQESLSNVASHAPNAVVHVELEYGPSLLVVRVVNEPSKAATTSSRSGPGHGLLGMRERAALLGGQLEAGPLDDGGYRVEATLPLDGGDAGFVDAEVSS